MGRVRYRCIGTARGITRPVVGPVTKHKDLEVVPLLVCCFQTIAGAGADAWRVVSREVST